MEPKNKSILISGASIAGLTLAYWLEHYGFKVTVVEIASEPRQGGSPIDVRGRALAVAERMGILEKIKAAKMNTERIVFSNAQNRTTGSMKPDTGADGLDIELERSHLVGILYGMTCGKVEYLFENSIASIIEHNDGIDAEFRQGDKRSFDYIIGADGLHSVVRKLAFGEEEKFSYYLGLYVSVFDVDEKTGMKNHCQLFNVPGRLACTYSFNNKAVAMLAFRSGEQINYDYKDMGQQKELLLSIYKNDSWKVPEILAALKGTDKLYFDSVSQIKMTSWTKGRVALTGDAAYCASFLSGMGITLAMTGATALADELFRAHGDHTIAFPEYDRIFRPYVEPVQAGMARMAGFLVPQTNCGIWLRNKITLLFSLFDLINSRLNISFKAT